MSYQRRNDLGFPSLSPSLTRFLGALFALYALELGSQSLAGIRLKPYVWLPSGMGFHPYQLVTRYFIQGDNYVNVAIQIVVIAFFAPTLVRALPPARLVQAFWAAAAGGTALGLLVDALALGGGMSHGWSVLLGAGIAMFGLIQPHAKILLFFILPVPAGLMTWGSLAIALFGFLARPSLGSADLLGSILGMIAWWYLLGPGRRLRPTPPRTPQGFRVLPGGRNRDDDYIN